MNNYIFSAFSTSFANEISKAFANLLHISIVGFCFSRSIRLMVVL